MNGGFVSRLEKKRVACGALLVASVVAACGSEPKKDPVAPVSTASEAQPPGAGDAPSSAPEGAGGADGDAQAACDALVDEANSTLDAERIAVDKLCKKDDDCIAIRGRACAFNCVNAAIPKSEEKEWNEALEKVKNGPCKQWTEKSCASLRTRPQPACKERAVWCDKGHCAVKEI